VVVVILEVAPEVDLAAVAEAINKIKNHIKKPFEINQTAFLLNFHQIKF
jgi:hypothetical protein